MEKVSSPLATLLKAIGGQGRAGEYRVFGIWKKAVGPAVARHACPVALRGTKLTVIVDNSAWMQQLAFLVPEIMENINRAMGRNAITEIALKFGEIPAQPKAGEEPLPATVELDDMTRERIRGYIRDIGDPGTREAFRVLIERHFRHKKNC